MRKRLLIRLLFALGVLLVLLILLLWGLKLYLRPEPSARREIYQGVFWQVEDIPNESLGKGRIATVEVHLETPGLEFFIRPMDVSALAKGGHYRLSLADWEVFSENLSVLVNLTAYYPAEPWESYPGQVVKSVETLVLKNKTSHVDEHSYLFWWDKNFTGTLEASKPPSEAALSAAYWGFGVQGFQIYEGKDKQGTLADGDQSNVRTFVGLDADKKILYLIVFEGVKDYYMIDYAQELGITYGAQVDTGDASHVIVGPGASGVTPYTGIRGLRPLGSYIGIRAQPLE